jgi:hypothetical protein
MKTQKLQSIIPADAAKVLFILVATSITSTLLLLYSYLLKGFIPATNMTREYLICFGQIVFQGLLFLLFHRKYLLLDYLYQMMIVSLLGALLLSPVIISNIVLFPFSPGAVYYLIYFFIIVAFMFFEHKRRIKKINAPGWLTYTWVLYRVIVLWIIL